MVCIFHFVLCPPQSPVPSEPFRSSHTPSTVSGRTKGSTKISEKSALSYMLDIKPVGKLLLSHESPTPYL